MKVRLISDFLGVEVYEVRHEDNGEVLYKEIDRDLHTIRWYEDPKCEQRIDEPYWCHR